MRWINQPQSLTEWRKRATTRRLPSEWRRRACDAIYKALANLSGEALDDLPAVLRAVDVAYPFGERKNYPYKAWLLERNVLITALSSTPPSAEEFAVCEVAGDLVELGRLSEALELVILDAPKRLDRPCPSCGVRKGVPCRDPVIVTPQDPLGMPQMSLFAQPDNASAALVAPPPLPVWAPAREFEDRIVPHRARIEPRKEAV